MSLPTVAWITPRTGPGYVRDTLGPVFPPRIAQVEAHPLDPRNNLYADRDRCLSDMFAWLRHLAWQDEAFKPVKEGIAAMLFYAPRSFGIRLGSTAFHRATSYFVDVEDGAVVVVAQLEARMVLVDGALTVATVETPDGPRRVEVRTDRVLEDWQPTSESRVVFEPQELRLAWVGPV